MDCKLEICVDSVESALIAQAAGAYRVELCDNLVEGGTTPGYGTITSVRSNLTIDVNVIIRPRGSDFLYSDLEFDIMRRDIEICGESGINGVVIGLLRKDGTIDLERTARLIEFAHPMTVTFHRAFDMCADPFRALEELISIGITRLLTSGQKQNAVEGIPLIRQLVDRAGERIIIMPGGGINAKNINTIVSETRAREIHLTGRKIIQSEMLFRRLGIKMGGKPETTEFTRKIADSEKIKEIVNILRQN